MSLLDNFHRFASCVQIAHHIPGRIRLRLSLSDPLPQLNSAEHSIIAQAKGFKEALDHIAGVRSFRVNLMARSCTVEYDHRIIPFKAWPDLIEGKASEEAGILRRIIEQKYTEVACA
ncbi:MAG: cation transporter [Propionivibrio sp.]